MSTARSLIERLSRRQPARTCTIQRFTAANDNSLSPVETWATHLSNVMVAMQLTSGSEGERYGRENNRAFGTAYVQGGLDITAEDRLVWNSRTFDIQSVITPGEMIASDRLGFMKLTIEETATEPGND